MSNRLHCKAPDCSWCLDVSPEDPDSSMDDALDHIETKHPARDWTTTLGLTEAPE